MTWHSPLRFDLVNYDMKFNYWVVVGWHSSPGGLNNFSTRTLEHSCECRSIPVGTARKSHIGVQIGLKIPPIPSQ